MTFRELNGSDLNPELQQQATALFGQLTSSRAALPLDAVLNDTHRLTLLCCMEGDTLLEKGKKLGLTEILLFTGVQRKPAMALYESLGFKMKDSKIYIYEMLKVSGQ